uniref:Glutathione peroxidase n=1 Tax=Peronospora matthiolae TaxID=2874970 RepID=A0AAV1V1S2_9STRA
MAQMLLWVVMVVALASELLRDCCAADAAGDNQSFLDFSFKDLRGHEVSMRAFSAFPVILVVNVASECGYTDKNYRELQELYEKYHDEGFMVLGFPCNQFGGQEPGTNDDIMKFTQEKYHVTFPLFTKVDVNGDKAHPLFQFLKKRLDGFVTNDIKWNFTKFLIVNHEPVKRYGTTTSPLEIEKDIMQALHSSRQVNEFDDGGATDGDYGDAHDEF